MGIKIFSTSDLHIGMKYNSYPGEARPKLISARIDVLDKMIEIANKSNCNLFLIAGDLFDNSSDSMNKDLNKIISILHKFNGECVAILPGNHDFYQLNNFWSLFINNVLDSHIIILKDYKTFETVINGVNVKFFPAPCDLKNSEDNRLEWIKNSGEYDKNSLNILVAHGAIEGISIDLNDKYFKMTKEEIEKLPIDIAIVGHMHIHYPQMDNVTNEKIFVPGTPEPDGLNCRHEGYAWIIDIDDNKNVKAEKVKTGICRFYDKYYKIISLDELENYKKTILNDFPENKVVRLNLEGSLKKEEFTNKDKIFDEMKSKLLHFEINDNTRIKFTKDDIDKEFIKDSFPYRLLSKIDDEELLEIAYQKIQEAKK